MLTMRCRENHAVRKRDNNSCQKCGRKHSVARGREVKVQVHHTKPPNWDKIITAVREELLDEKNLVCLCKDCHDDHHDADKSGFRGNYGKVVEIAEKPS
jgi:5-methylcytosine-specific restriction endonuclease McrA